MPRALATHQLDVFLWLCLTAILRLRRCTRTQNTVTLTHVQTGRHVRRTDSHQQLTLPAWRAASKQTLAHTDVDAHVR